MAHALPQPGLTLEREARLIGEPVCYDKELERSLAINAKIGKNISVCLFPSAVNVFVCTSIVCPCSSVHATDYL